MSDTQLEFEYVEIDSLKPFKGNPRKISDKGLEKLQSSVESFGFTNPVLAQKSSRMVIAGHQRIKAAVAAGLSQVPVIWLDFDDEKAKAYNIADNRLNQESEWDYEALADLLQDLEDTDMDLTLTGFDRDELDELHMWEPQIELGDIIEDEPPPLVEEPFSLLGDLWALGAHRLLCGDSTKMEDILTLMGGQTADMVFTDPPYNVDVTGGTKKALKIKGDHQSDYAYYRFLEDVFKNLYQVTEDGGAIYVFHADTESLNVRMAFRESGFKLSQGLVWVKHRLVLSRQDYHWQHESIAFGWKESEKFYEEGHQPIMYGWKPTAGHVWNGDRRQTTVWEFDRPLQSKEHPTMKPVSLCAYGISNSSRKGNIVLDPFGGSGSTLIACEQIGRVCYMCELDPKYADVILTRYLKFTEEEPILISTGQTWTEIRQERGE